MDAGPIVQTVAGAVLLAGSIAGARRPALPRAEMAAFRAVNRLPDGWFPILWVPMQFGNLVVGMLSGFAVALVLRDGTVAVATVVATGGKLVVERLIRNRVGSEVRQRPGTSEPGAIVRGRDVPRAGPSFPSGHVLMASAIVSSVSHVVPAGVGAFAWLLVALVAIGRVYVGAHNPLDVTAGLGAGLVLGGVVNLLIG
jgi:undecaprenyl-diphosphatase